MKKPYKRLSSKIILKNKWYSVRQDKVIMPDGQKGEYNVVVSPASVYVVAANDKHEVALIKLFRYPTQRWSIEVPAGSSDGKPLLAAAKRELWEEAGLKAKIWKKIGKYQIAPGIMSEIGHIFLAKDLNFTKNNKQSQEGIVQVDWFSYPKALEMIEQGLITDAHTIISLCFARPFFQNKHSE